jgi:hypothetical protein
MTKNTQLAKSLLKIAISKVKKGKAKFEGIPVHELAEVNISFESKKYWLNIFKSGSVFINDYSVGVVFSNTDHYYDSNDVVCNMLAATLVLECTKRMLPERHDLKEVAKPEMAEPKPELHPNRLRIILTRALSNIKDGKYDKTHSISAAERYKVNIDENINVRVVLYEGNLSDCTGLFININDNTAFNYYAAKNITDDEEVHQQVYLCEKIFEALRDKECEKLMMKDKPVDCKSDLKPLKSYPNEHRGKNIPALKPLKKEPTKKPDNIERRERLHKKTKHIKVHIEMWIDKE